MYFWDAGASLILSVYRVVSVLFGAWVFYGYDAVGPTVLLPFISFLPTYYSFVYPHNQIISISLSSCQYLLNLEALLID